MIGFHKKSEHSGAIPLGRDNDLAADSFELARFWISPKLGRSQVFTSFKGEWEPELLGSLLVESVHTAAAAYAVHLNIPEEEALRRIWHGFDEERAKLAPEGPKEEN